MPDGPGAGIQSHDVHVGDAHVVVILGQLSATGTGSFRGNLGDGTFSLGHGTVRLSHPRNFVKIDGYSYPYFTHALLAGVNGSVNNWICRTRHACWTR